MRGMKTIFKYVVILVAALSMSSCAQSIANKVSIEGYDNFHVLGFSGVKLDVILRNESAKDIELRNVVLTLHEGREHIATLELKGWLGLPRRTESVTLPTVWRLSDVDPMEALLTSKAILAGENLGAYYVNVMADVTYGKIERSVERRYISLVDIIESVGVKIDE